MRPTHSQHSITNPSETDSLPATRPILPTALSELLFQRPQNQGLPRLRDFVTAVFSVGFEHFVLSLLVSTSSRLLESCSPLILLGTSFLLATTHFCFAAHFHHNCVFFTSSLLFKSGSSLSLFFLPLILFVFLLSLTACRAFGSLHWCIYTLVHTYLRLVLPSLRSLRGLCSSCSRPAISTLLAVLRHLHSSHRLKHLHSSHRLETPPHFSPS